MAASTDDESGFLRLELASARAAAHELSTTDEVLIEKIAQLAGEVADLRIALAHKESECESLRTLYDAVTVSLQSKSAALTQLLVPHTPPSARALREHDAASGEDSSGPALAGRPRNGRDGR